ncbi:olfactory receptor 8J2-like [Discoglossus pictus]
MEQTNRTTVTYFILKGISDAPHLQTPIFLLVLYLYLLTLVGNITILQLICLDPQLHTPMYFFLGNLSLLDMSSTTVTLHKVLISFILRDKIVSFPNCIAQVYFFSVFTCNELMMLTAMSYDRYVAICDPLHYPLVMSRTVCVLLATLCWVLAFIELIPYLVLLIGISCYKSNIINHFYCDCVPLIKLSCSDTSVLEIVVVLEGFVFITLPLFLLTFISYIFIIRTILRIRSNTGRRKAFYTCSSHLTVVLLLYGTLICQYFRPTSINSLESNKLVSLFNTAAVPVLNPLIYSLKNEDVKSALKRRFSSIVGHLRLGWSSP